MKIGVLDLKPTQFVVGRQEIDVKIDKFAGLDGKKLEAYLDDHVVPCIVGPRKQFFMIDHHHFVAAAYDHGHKEVKVSILEDQSKLEFDAFWRYMDSRKWLYLYDQFGGGPHPASMLPLDVRGLADDLYRSLAWELRDAGIIPKIQEPFAEFKWAKFLRTHITVDLHQEKYSDAVKRCKELVSASLDPDVLKAQKGT